ncbi:MAG: MetQ/NlpA family ABC transporter substrate-binding protein [Erysipelotrichales bacterium]|nr:MetQ/NlpA family ABC transporter substrate-binding protein [Erysipelotrichales bacterium]
MKKILIIGALIIAVLILNACSNDNPYRIRVGASSTPHAQILELVREDLAAEGFELVISTFSDFILPNLSLDQRELDANFFQHKPFMNNFNETRGTDLVSIGGIHYEPLGIYSNTLNSLEGVQANSRVLIPIDLTNQARALLLLEANGLITLREGAGIAATPNDIIGDPLNLTITPMTAALIPAALANNEAALGVINGNFALQNGLSINDALAIETKDSTAALTYVNIVAVRRGTEDDPRFAALINALQSQKVIDFIEQNFYGAVVPLFTDRNGNPLE